MKKTPILAFLAITAAASAQQSGHKIQMVFTDTDAAYVLQAISKQTGESILYNSKVKIPVTINLSVDTAEEAIRAVSSAASLASRHVGSVYVVAPIANMKDALAPFSTTSLYSVDGALADQIASKVQDSLPYATVRAIGEKISVTATKEDQLEAEDLIREQIRAQKSHVAGSAIITMQRVTAEEIAPLIKTLYPGLDVTASLQSKAPVAPSKLDDGSSRIVIVSYGFIALQGPQQLVAAARETIEKLDAPVSADGPNKVVVSIYNLKYANGPSLTTLLKKTFPELDAFVGPEQFSPSRPTFSPVIAQVGQAASANGGSGGGGSSAGSSGGSSGGGGGGGAAGGSTTGTTSTGGGGTSLGTGLHAPSLGDRAKAIVLRGRQGDVDSAMKLLGDLDIKPRQVRIEVKVIETSPTDSANLGVSYTFSPVNFYDVAPGSLISGLTGAIGLTGGATSPFLPAGISRTPLNFQATLNAMVSNQTAKLLATPTLQVIDNDQGSIFIGNTISVELTSVGSLGASSQSIAQFPVGIILLVSPRISPDGSVTLHVNPVVSTVSSINAQGIPQTSAREAETTMIVKDGQTMIIGGLIQDQDTKTISQVPLLSSLPIIGELFKNRSRTHNRTDIIISITPYIVKELPDGGK